MLKVLDFYLSVNASQICHEILGGRIPGFLINYLNIGYTRIDFMFFDLPPI